MEYINTPMNYTGSKFKLLEQILPELDYTKSKFIDLFTGGGSVYTNILDKYDKVIINDIIEDLVGIHKGILEDDLIIELTKEICPEKGDKESFLKLRNDFNESKAPHKLWALMLSSTNNMLRFNKKFLYNQTYGERGWNSNIDKKLEIYKEHIRKYKNKIEHLSLNFNDVKVLDSDYMVYIDPPYSNTEAGYNSYWNKDDDEKLFNYCINLNNIGASFAVSGTLKHNDSSCLLLDKLIEYGFKYKELVFDYNKVSRIGNKDTKEIIIKNF